MERLTVTCYFAGGAGFLLGGAQFRLLRQWRPDLRWGSWWICLVGAAVIYQFLTLLMKTESRSWMVFWKFGYLFNHLPGFFFYSLLTAIVMARILRTTGEPVQGDDSTVAPSGGGT